MGLLLTSALMGRAVPGRAVERPSVKPWKAVERAVPPGGADEACLGRPIALALDARSLFVVDAQDCAVKVFSKDGAYERSVGSRGGGPGELSFPSGACVLGGRLYVADKFNRRIQAFDGKGSPSGGFPVPYAPDKVFGLGGDSLLVTSNPTGRMRLERLLHVYDLEGRLRWEGLESESSSDPVFDAFRNMVLVCPGPNGGFCVIHKSGERSILQFAGPGAAGRRILVDERHETRPVDLPFKGPMKRLLGFCWAAAWDGGLFYLSAPEPVAGKDLGPGRRLSVIDREGILTAVVDLPCAVHRFIVEGRLVFAIDDEGGLRIFEVVR
jgi:hypothetical protein